MNIVQRSVNSEARGGDAQWQNDFRQYRQVAGELPLPASAVIGEVFGLTPDLECRTIWAVIQRTLPGAAEVYDTVVQLMQNRNVIVEIPYRNGAPTILPIQTSVAVASPNAMLFSATGTAGTFLNLIPWVVNVRCDGIRWLVRSSNFTNAGQVLYAFIACQSTRC